MATFINLIMINY